MSAPKPRAGFSLVEVIVAIVILAFGLLAMASATGFFFTQIRVADLNTERASAVERAIEDLRSVPLDSVKTRAQSNARTYGLYSVWWTVNSSDGNLSRVTIYTSGRGYDTRTGFSSTVQDSFAVAFVRGLQPTR